MIRRTSTVGFLAVLAGIVPAAATAGEDPWALLAAGGRVVLLRHTATTPEVGDPPGMRLDDCRTQRNLTEEGRRHARQIGEAFRARGVAISRVLSSPWCRCLETARLAFGGAEISPALGNLFGRPENREGQVREMQAIAGEPIRRGNLVLVSHGSTIRALTGVSPEMGEMVVVTPRGKGRFEIAARLSVPLDPADGRSSDIIGLGSARGLVALADFKSVGVPVLPGWVGSIPMRFRHSTARRRRFVHNPCSG